jgi:hypothetical protein
MSPEVGWSANPTLKKHSRTVDVLQIDAIHARIA